MNVRPKTSSWGGTSSLGVVDFVMDSFEGSMPGSLAIESSCACMLYTLRHRKGAVHADGSSSENSEAALLKSVWRSMATAMVERPIALWQQSQAVCGAHCGARSDLFTVLISILMLADFLTIRARSRKQKRAKPKRSSSEPLTVPRP